MCFMNLMAIDDERLALDNLLDILREVRPRAGIKGFLYPRAALAEIENGFRPDVAFLDLDLSGMDGIVLAQRLQKALPKINLIFVTRSADYPYMTDAFALHASGYLTKPVSKEQLREELNNLRYPIQSCDEPCPFDGNAPRDALRDSERGDVL